MSKILQVKYIWAGETSLAEIVIEASKFAGEIAIGPIGRNPYHFDPAALIAAIRQVSGIADDAEARKQVEMIKVLREVVEQYADSSNWHFGHGRSTDLDQFFQSDGGDGFTIAQEALAKADRIESGKEAEG